MQNSYLQMMQDTQRLIERANDISANAERVISMLKEHKRDIEEIQAMVSGRFELIRNILADDEANYMECFALFHKELNEAIAAIEGRETEAKPEEGHPEAPIEPPVEATHAEA